MKCAEIYNWINSASETELKSPPSAISNHLMTCNNCDKRVAAIKQSFYFLNSQKNESLSEEKTAEIIDCLLTPKYVLAPKIVNARFIINRVAVIFIIAFGLLTGIVVGRLFFSETDSSNPWSNEFTLLSDNSDYVLFD